MNSTTLRTGLAWCLTLSLLILLPSCDQARPDLDVENKQQPDRDQVLGTPSDVEGISQGLFLDFLAQGTGLNAVMLEAMSDTHSSNWANFAMNRMASEPRVSFNNSSSYTYAYTNEDPWYDGYTVISNSSDVLNAIDNLGEESFQAEGVDPARMRAFSNFMMGAVYGRFAAHYDRAFLVDQTTDFEAVARGDSELQLQPYPEVLDFALQKLNNAKQIAEQGHSAIPPAWVPGNEITSQELIYLINSMKARFVAWTARSPEQRRSLSYTDATWSDVKGWIEDGIEQTGYTGQWGPRKVEFSCRPINCPNAANITGGEIDIPKERSKTTPAGFAWVTNSDDTFSSVKWYTSQSNTWARADYRMIGAADVTNNESDCQGTVSGDDGEISCYPEYINTLEGGEWSNDLTPFKMETPDRRIQGPEGPDDHGKYMDYVGTSLSAFPPSRGSYHYSDRTFVRYLYHAEGGGFGPGEPMPFLTKPEMDLLKAEANLHMGNTQAAADLIDNTRVEQGELSSASGAPVGDITQPPNPVGDYPTDEPTLWSMLQYEFRIETINTKGGLNFYMMRGWGIGPEGTPAHFPIPGQELNTLGKQVYTFGGDRGCTLPLSGTPGDDCFGGQSGGSSSSALRLDTEQMSTLKGVDPIRSVINSPVPRE